MTPRSRSVRIYVRDGLAEPIVEGTDLLVSVGRTPNTQGIGLEHVGIELDDRGFIKVNDQEHRAFKHPPIVARTLWDKV